MSSSDSWFAALTAGLRVPKDIVVDRLPVPEKSPEDGPQEMLFRQVTRTLDIPVPFTFPADLHGYIFGDIAPSSSPASQLIRWQVEWKGQFHSYYQETSRRYLFLYLPDSFKLARRPERPHVPFLSVHFDSDDGTLDKTRATMSFAATPFVDGDRLRAAAEELAGKVDGPLPSGITGPTFQPALAGADRLKFRLALPGGSGLFQPRDSAQINLKLGIVDAVILSVTEFRSVFDAMMGSGGAVLMRGEIEVGLGGGDIPSEKIPFSPRFDDLNGPIFDSTEEPDPPTGGVRVTLTNGIESPVRISRLAAQLRVQGTSTSAEIRNLSLPVDRLAASEGVTMVVAPVQRLEGAHPVRAAFDFDGVTVLPDREAIWTAVLDPTTAQLPQTITVKTLPELFAPPSDGSPALAEIDVELKVGAVTVPTVALTAAQPEGQATLPFPIGDFVLGRANAGEFEYRVTAIRTDAPHEGPWKKKSGDRLWVLAQDVS